MRHLEHILLTMLLTWSSLTTALDSDRHQPVGLSADSVDLDEDRNISIYKGNVELRQGSMYLRANRVTIHHRQRKPDRIVAEGRPVRFEQDTGHGRIKARARKTEYVVNSEILHLIGNAVLVQNGNTMKSDRIVYDRVKHKVRAGAAAKGKQRVRITIQSGQ